MKYSEIRTAAKTALGITKCTGSTGADVSLSNKWAVRVRRIGYLSDGYAGGQPLLYILSPIGHTYGGHVEKHMGQFVTWAMWFMEEKF